MKTIQQSFEEASAELLEIYKRRKILDEKRAEELKPHKDQITTIIDNYKKFYLDVIGPELELREYIKALYLMAKIEQQEAYDEALAAQKCGDMQALKEATLKANEASITANSNVFFRNNEQAIVVDITKIPMEYLTVDMTKISKDKEIPGIKWEDVPSVVVKESK